MSIDFRVYKCVYDNRKPVAEVKMGKSWLYVCEEHLTFYKQKYKGKQEIRMLKTAKP